MRVLCLVPIVATLALAACHPASTPSTQGSLDNAAQAVSAGSAPATGDPVGVTVPGQRAASDVAGDAAIASAAIGAQTASGPAATAASR